MSFDPHLNLRRSTVAGAPSPALSGTSLTLAAATGANFPATSGGAYNLICWPSGQEPTQANTEIIRVVTRAGDVLSSILRAQEGTAARAIAIGDNVALVPTAKTFTDIEAATTIPGNVIYLGGPAFNNVFYPATIVGLRDAIAALVALTPSGGKVKCPEGVAIVSDGTVVDVPSYVWVEFGGPTAPLRAPANATGYTDGLIRALGTAGADGGLAVTSALGANTVQTDPGVVAGLGIADNSILYITASRTGVGQYGWQLSRVLGAPAGEVITLSRQIMILHGGSAALDGGVTDEGWVNKLTPVRGARISNLWLDSNGNTGEGTRGLVARFSVNCRFEDIHWDGGFSKGEGMLVDGNLENHYRDCGGYASGHAAVTQTGDLHLGHGETGSTFIDCWSADAASYGLFAGHAHECMFIATRSNEGAGRSIKLATSSFCTVIGAQASGRYGASQTGISISDNASWNTFIGCQALGHNYSGFWIDEVTGPCRDNVFIGCIARNNNRANDGQNADVLVPNNAYGTIFIGLNPDATVIDQSGAMSTAGIKAQIMTGVIVNGAAVGTTETSLLPAQSIANVSGSYTIGGKSVRLGQTMQLTMGGVYSSAATPHTVRIRVKLGSTVILDTGAFTPTGSLSNVAWMLNATMTVRALGASGNIVPIGMLTLQNAAGVAAPLMVPLPVGVYTIDWTANQTLAVTVQFGTGAAAGDDWQCSNLELIAR